MRRCGNLIGSSEEHVAGNIRAPAASGHEDSVQGNYD